MSSIASVYGQALYDLARDEDCTDGVLHELKILKSAFTEEADFVRLVSTPGIPKAERLQILDDSFRSRVHPYVLNFMKILAEKGYMNSFCECAEVYLKAYNEDHNILPVKVTSAVALTPEQESRLRRKLSSLTGKQIELIGRIDPACIGGLRLDYDGKQVDDTVAGRLDRLHSMLKNTAL